MINIPNEVLEHFDSDTIVQHYSITYLDLRALKHKANLISSEDLNLREKEELRYMYMQADVELDEAEELAESLHSTEHRVQTAMLGQFNATDYEQRDREIVRDILDGIPHSEIATKYRVSVSRVSQLNPNPIRKPRKVKLTGIQWQELISQYPRFTISELAQLYQVSRAAIYRRLVK